MQALIDFITQVIAIADPELLELDQVLYSVSFLLQCCLLIVFCKQLNDVHCFTDKEIEQGSIDMQETQPRQQQTEQNSVGGSDSSVTHINQNNNSTLNENMTEQMQFWTPPLFNHSMEEVNDQSDP